MTVHRVAVAIALLLLLGACATAVPGVADPIAPASVVPSSTVAPSVSPTTVRESPRYTPAVAEPKDLRGIPACDLLKADQLTDLGLRPETAEETIQATTRSCGWLSATDDSNPAGLELNDDTTIPVLDGLYLTRDVLINYGPLEVAGHPAVRADYADDGQCTIITAVSDYQGVGTEGNPAARSSADPCALAIRMAEFIIANLPPLTEE